MISKSVKSGAKNTSFSNSLDHGNKFMIYSELLTKV
jgi:hypothetical protein